MRPLDLVRERLSKYGLSVRSWNPGRKLYQVYDSYTCISATRALRWNELQEWIYGFEYQFLWKNSQGAKTLNKTADKSVGRSK